MNHSVMKSLVHGMLLAGMALPCLAEDLAWWNFDSHDTSWYADDSVQTQALSVATGVATSTVTHANPANLRDGGYWHDVMGSIDWDETSLADAVSASLYYRWVTAAAPGQRLTVTNLAFEFGENNGSGEEFTIAIMTDADGFSAGNEIATTTMNNSQNGATLSVAVTDAAYSGLTNLEIRIYAYSSGADAVDSADRFTLGEVGTPDGALDLLLQGTLGSAGTKATTFTVR